MSAIAHILGSLDDKIELNRQMNQTLEAMARAIFKSWFVDFDPVHAKLALSGDRRSQAEGANGDDYPLDAETMALFPDRFEDSVLGEIPAGWEVRSVRRHCLGGCQNGTCLARRILPEWDDGIHCFVHPRISASCQVQGGFDDSAATVASPDIAET